MNSICTSGDISPPTRLTVVALTAFFAVGFLQDSAHAGPPEILFDTAATIGCCDVTPPEFAEANPDERLVEATFQVSSLIRSGSEEDLIQYFYRIESPHRGARVADYLPKTTMVSEVAGNVSIEKKKEDLKSLGLSISGSYEKLLRANATGSVGSKNNSTVRYELLPPLEMVAASGTLSRGAGVYFKLKPSPLESLEGSKQLVLVLRVPKNWRGDFVYLDCRAQGYRRGLVRPLDDPVPCGGSRFVVALYAEGDVAAKGIAADYAQAENDLRRVVAFNRREIKKAAYPSAAHKVGAALDIVEPKIPPGWMERSIFGLPTASLNKFLWRLPEEVRTAVGSYRESKLRLNQLNGRQNVGKNERAERK